MPPATRAFLDTSAVFTAIWSEEGGGRMILRLGEAGAVKIVLCRQVLVELERALRRKAPQALPLLAVLLDRARIEVGPEPDCEIRSSCQRFVTHAGDAAILAAAVGASADCFVTLDRQHFLQNPDLQRAVPFLVGTPGDFLAWYRKGLISAWRASGGAT